MDCRNKSGKDSLEGVSVLYPTQSQLQYPPPSPSTSNHSAQPSHNPNPPQSPHWLLALPPCPLTPQSPSAAPHSKPFHKTQIARPRYRESRQTIPKQVGPQNSLTRHKSLIGRNTMAFDGIGCGDKHGINSCSNAMRIWELVYHDSILTEIGAGEGIRTLDPDLGKVNDQQCRHYPNFRYVAISI
jgi:hypothetical protein